LKGKGSWTLEIIKRSGSGEASKFYRAAGRRKNLCVLGRCRRLAKDFEASITSAVAWVPSPTSERSPTYRKTLIKNEIIRSDSKTVAWMDWRSAIRRARAPRIGNLKNSSKTRG